MSMPTSMLTGDQTSTGFGCGKVILLGEHAVVHGQPALVAGMRAGVRAHASPGRGVVSAPAWGLEVEVGDASLPGQAVARLLQRLQIPATLDFWLECEVPARAGLGSSAAMSVAIARAAGARVGADDAAVMAAVSDAESVFHRKPSGIDAAAASRGGVGAYDRQAGWQSLACGARVELCIGLSGQSHDTGAMVAGVGQLCEGTPVARRLVETLGDLARAGTEALVAGDVATLARIFNMAHGLLAGLGVSCPELDELVYTARAAGAAGAKLTGAGGGGAVIAIAGGHGDQVLRAWRSKGYYGFLTTLEP
jgi:mevalonate kinase